MQHLFKQGENDFTLLLLHGTGGDEYDLLPLADLIHPKASVLSVRGNVNEQGMNRYFKRLGEGVFDLDDLIFRTKELYAFMQTASQTYQFNRNKVIAVGYSNGANIAGSLLYQFEKGLHGAVKS